MAHQFLFYASPEAIRENRIRFDRRESHHISDVLRSTKGSLIEATDGLGWIYRVHLAVREGGCWIGEILDKRSGESAAPLPISLALPCLKADRWAWPLETACELGIEAIWLVDFAQSALRWNQARAERAHRKAIEALKQSGGSRLTLIHCPVSLEDLLQQTDEAQVWAADPTGQPLADLRASVLLLIGPEAGFGAEEDRLLQIKRTRRFSLGSRRLRTEVAAAAALAQAALRMTINHKKIKA